MRPGEHKTVQARILKYAGEIGWIFVTRKEAEQRRGFDGLTYFVYRMLLDAEIKNAEEVSRKIKNAFVAFPNWKKSENALRELRKKVTFAILANSDDMDRVTALVDGLFTLLEKANRI